MAIFDSVLYALLRTYVKKSLIGAGAIKGASCQILSIERNLTDDGTVVTFKYEDNAGGVHTSTMNVPDGIDGEKGDKGDKGDKGNTGERGLDGAAGPVGRTATVQIGSVSSGEIASIENVGTNNDAVFNFVLPKGEKGDKGANGEDGQDGKSFDIKGQYPNYAALIAAHPTGTAGEAYFVGTDNNPDLYIWLTEDAVWHNSGKIAGVKGDKGDTGEDGFSPIASVSKTGDTTTVIIRDKTGQTSVQIKDGEKGDPGVGEPVFNGTQAQWDGLTLEQKLEYLTGMVVINDDYDESDYVKKEEIGTAATKNFTDTVRPNSHDLVESNAVYSAINTAVSSIYTVRGDITCAELTADLLILENVGSIFETSDSGTTTSLFMQGAGIPIPAGMNVGIVKAGENTILFNLMAGAFDIAGIVDNIKNILHPVGSVYLTMGNTNPADLLGFGTWAALSDGYLRTGGTNASGGSLTTGGHAITVNEMPSHNHGGATGGMSANQKHKHNITSTKSFGVASASMELFAAPFYQGTSTLSSNIDEKDLAHTHSITAQGGGQAHTHSIEPTYTRVYAWQRTA